MHLASEITSSGAPAIEQAVMLSHMLAEQLRISPIVRGGILNSPLVWLDSRLADPSAYLA